MPTSSSSAAGFAGLTAAREIVRRRASRCIVLEARDRVGGRVCNHELAGGELSERGGTFVGPTQDRDPRARARQLGVETFDTYAHGRQRLRRRGRPLDATATPARPAPRRGPADRRRTSRRRSPRLERACPRRSRSTRRGRAERAPSGTARPSRPGSTTNSASPRFRGSCPSPRARSSAPSRASSRCCSCSSTSPRPATSSTPGTFDRNFNTRDGAQKSRFRGGSQVIAIEIAAALGTRVILRNAGPPDRARTAAASRSTRPACTRRRRAA